MFLNNELAQNRNSQLLLNVFVMNVLIHYLFITPHRKFLKMQQNCDKFAFTLAANPLPARFQLYRKEKKLTDVTIKIGNVKTEAHRLVLEDSSPVIRAALSDNWSNRKHNFNIKKYKSKQRYQNLKNKMKW